MQSQDTKAAVPATAPFVLTPPDAVPALADNQVREANPISSKAAAAVEAQVDRFMSGLLTEDVNSDEFRKKLDGAYALGRSEIAISSTLMQGRFMSTNFVGVEDSSAFKAINEMRNILDQLNPGKDGDLFQPRKLLGIIPFGNKLTAYFRKFESASSHLQKAMQQIYAAKDEMQRDVVEIESTRSKLWGGMEKLNSAIYFAELLDKHLSEHVDSLKATDPDRARAIEQEVLFYARQNLSDMLMQMSVCTSGYLSLDVLKKSGREMMNGCSRIATTGMDALVIAQTVARSTGNQIKVAAMLKGVNTTIETLVAETGRQLNTHVENTADFASNPMLGVEKLREMFDQTFKAMDAMDTFRAKALVTMGENNKLIAGQIKRAEVYVDRVRQSTKQDTTNVTTEGPVHI